MNVICKVCDGSGKVDKEFGMGKCKEIPDDYYHRVCPACDGKGYQYENDRPVSYPNPIIIKPFPKRCPNPYKPDSDPWKRFDPYDPYRIPRRKKMYTSI